MIGIWLFALAGWSLPARAISVTFDNPYSGCALASSPGDILLQDCRACDPEVDENCDPGESPEISTFGRATSVAFKIKEVLALNPLAVNMKYCHSEVLTDIESGKNFVSDSFYPPIFQKMRGVSPKDEKPAFRRYSINNFEYRSHFSVYLVRGYTQSHGRWYREQALERVDHKETYSGWGTCADFVEWAFQSFIGHPLNQIPGIKVLISSLALGGASPDNIAQSPNTKKICEFSQDEGARVKLEYPTSLSTKTVVARMQNALGSKNEHIAAHARWIQKTLVEKSVLSSDGVIVDDEIVLESDVR